jgi:hypothetical protein
MTVVLDLAVALRIYMQKSDIRADLGCDALCSLLDGELYVCVEGTLERQTPQLLGQGSVVGLLLVHSLSQLLSSFQLSLASCHGVFLGLLVALMHTGQ